MTAIELMPLADFPGGRNWGYDGVLPYAPNTAYGTPDELKALVDEAHGLGLRDRPALPQARALGAHGVGGDQPRAVAGRDGSEPHGFSAPSPPRRGS